MFTGIVTAVGTIREARQQGDLHAVIACPFDPAGGDAAQFHMTVLDTLPGAQRDPCLQRRRFLGEAEFFPVPPNRVSKHAHNALRGCHETKGTSTPKSYSDVRRQR